MPVLELGCGTGADTAVLLDAGLHVIGIDASSEALSRAALAAPGATYLAQDLREPWPVNPRSTGVVLASLSLHYFSWAETTALFERIKQALSPGGLFLCRLNSTEDVHFGATGHPELEPNFYLVGDQPKRFFDRAAIESVVGHPWQVISLTHYSTGKYGKPKALWELACTRSAV